MPSRDDEEMMEMELAPRDLERLLAEIDMQPITVTMLVRDARVLAACARAQGEVMSELEAELGRFSRPRSGVAKDQLREILSAAANLQEVLTALVREKSGR